MNEVDDEGNVMTGEEEVLPSWVTESDSVQVEDLSAVQPDILPVCQGVLGRIKKASIKPSANRELKSLKLEMTIVEGVPIANAKTGETEMKFVGKTVFPGFNDLLIWADPVKKTSQWFKSKQHLLPFKQFCTALGFDLKSVKVDNAWCAELVGRSVLFGVRHEAESQVNPATGERVKTGLLRERIGGWKRAPEE